MKKLTKAEILQLRGYIAALNVVGLTPEKSLLLLRLHRKVKEVVEEINHAQRDMIDKYGISIIEGSNMLDTQSENFGEYDAAYQALITEQVELTEFCIFTESEAMVAVKKVDAPITIVDDIVRLLTAEKADTENE